MENEIDFHHRGGGESQSRGRWSGTKRPRFGHDIAALAARQHGAVAKRQLEGLGVSRRQIDGLVAAGVLHPIHRGVYAVGHARLTRQGRWMAAVLAGGPGAVLSHRSAAMHWQLIGPFDSTPHVTTRHSRRRRRGLVHHAALLPDDETTIRDGIPITTVARTILDLASSEDRHRLERAMSEAEFRRYADAPSLRQLMERYPRRRGIRALRAIHASGNVERGVTRSPLEERFLRFLDARRLERPELNAPLQLEAEIIVPDCLWRRRRVAVELDGRAAHLRARRWESDRVRDRNLLVAGWKPIRVTSEQLDTDPDGLEADLRALGIAPAEARGGAAV